MSKLTGAVIDEPDAGVVLRRRSGREVLYWRTPLGDSLAAAGGGT